MISHTPWAASCAAGRRGSFPSPSGASKSRTKGLSWKLGWGAGGGEELLQGSLISLIPLVPSGTGASSLGRSQWASQPEPGLLGGSENGKTLKFILSEATGLVF